VYVHDVLIDTGQPRVVGCQPRVIPCLDVTEEEACDRVACASGLVLWPLACCTWARSRRAPSECERSRRPSPR
jgi:hypothetical protein